MSPNQKFEQFLKEHLPYMKTLGQAKAVLHWAWHNGYQEGIDDARKIAGAASETANEV